jgi:chromate transporter
MRRLLVQRRHWVDEAQFFEMFAACQLIPGPSSTELAILLGYRRAGWPGLLVGGVCFIAPAMALMLLIAALYQHFGSSATAQRVLAGVTPVVVGIVLWAVTDLGLRLLRAWDAALLFAAVAAVAVFVNQPIALLAAGGLVLAALRWARSRPASNAAPSGAAAPVVVAAGTTPGGGSSVAVAMPGLLAIFATFLKLGAVAFGSGYVLLALLHSEFVVGLHWLTDRQVVDAVAISQATPGPVFTTATFIGFLLGGVGGGLVATAGIFLPGFALVPLLDQIRQLVRRRRLVREALTGVNVAALGLIVAVAVALARASFSGPIPVVTAAVTLAVLLRWPLASPALVVAGALVGGFLG